jgi:hypothetical protein
MTWFAWRQSRTPIFITLAAGVIAAILLAITHGSLETLWSDSGAAACTTNCGSVMENFIRQVGHTTNSVVYQVALVVMYLLPALVGAFWGAPMIARELETGTHRLAWNQSVSRTRWLATKLGIGAVASASIVGLLSWAVTVWSQHIDQAQYYRITPISYGARGIVPIAYTLFAFALGVTMGMLIRRTVPAIAATLAIYAAMVFAMPLWVRGHLMPPVRQMSTLDVSRNMEMMLSNGGKMRVVSSVVPDGAWVLKNDSITTAGQVFSGPANPQACGENAGPRACLDWLGTLGLRQDLVYQPANHFWPLQWIESGIFVALAAALFGFCFWWTQRRLA